MKASTKKPIIPLLILAAVNSVLSVSVLADENRPASHTAATELLWVDSGFGPQVSPVFGQLSKGGHVTFVKFAAGMTTPLHKHTHDYTGVVITGISMHWEPGRPETKKQLSAGAHWFMPANVEHVSECLPGVECIMALYQNDFMDFIPAKK
ncbi:MAG: hypothetical protein AB8B87_01410 [Granulosicoccus sp.]